MSKSTAGEPHFEEVREEEYVAFDPNKLKKGQRAELAGLRSVRAFLSWGARDGQKPDLDLSALLLGANGKMPGEEALIYYNNTCRNKDGTPTGPVYHKGDVRDGGDEEWISTDLARIDPRTRTILLAITSYSESEPIHFGRIRDAVVWVMDEGKNEELCRYDLTEDMSGFTAVEAAAFRRDGQGWVFEALGRCVGKAANGLTDIIDIYG
ncbi:MAG TPA: TerD family protein [Thermoanaerobaculia bacterium]|nr:TerD family protein [Thermoanaerobaculia bacterium]HQP86396.1 TerD family protein [Thermoanaerobaculia bacterium]